MTPNPLIGRRLSLARRPFLRQLLRSLPRRAPLVLGDLLADGRHLLVAACAMVLCQHPDSRSPGGAERSEAVDRPLRDLLRAFCGASAASPTASQCATSASRSAWPSSSGLCTVFGTLIPPIFGGEFQTTLARTRSGKLCSHRASPSPSPRASSRQRSPARVKMPRSLPNRRPPRSRSSTSSAAFLSRSSSGIMSSCFAFGLSAGEPIKAISIAHGTGPLWAGLPVLCLVMFGGLITNSLWCAYLIFRNKSAGEWFGRTAAANPRAPAAQAAGSDQASNFEPALLTQTAARPGPTHLCFAISSCALLLARAWYFQVRLLSDG